MIFCFLLLLVVNAYGSLYQGHTSFKIDGTLYNVELLIDSKTNKATLIVECPVDKNADWCAIGFIENELDDSKQRMANTYAIIADRQLGYREERLGADSLLPNNRGIIPRVLSSLEVVADFVIKNKRIITYTRDITTKTMLTKNDDKNKDSPVFSFKDGDAKYQVRYAIGPIDAKTGTMLPHTGTSRNVRIIHVKPFACNVGLYKCEVEGVVLCISQPNCGKNKQLKQTFALKTTHIAAAARQNFHKRDTSGETHTTTTIAKTTTKKPTRQPIVIPSPVPLPTTRPPYMTPPPVPAPSPIAPTPRPTSRAWWTKAPTPQPTNVPTNQPTQKPTANPTYKPTPSPTNKPTRKPTTKTPTNTPTPRPTKKPTKRPRIWWNVSTKKPTKKPTSSWYRPNAWADKPKTTPTPTRRKTTTTTKTTKTKDKSSSDKSPPAAAATRSPNTKCDIRKLSDNLVCTSKICPNAKDTEFSVELVDVHQDHIKDETTFSYRVSISDKRPVCVDTAVGSGLESTRLRVLHLAVDNCCAVSSGEIERMTKQFRVVGDKLRLLGYENGWMFETGNLSVGRAITLQIVVRGIVNYNKGSWSVATQQKRCTLGREYVPDLCSLVGSKVKKDAVTGFN